MTVLSGCSILKPKQEGSPYAAVGPDVLMSNSTSLESYQKVREARATNSVVLEIQDDSEPIRMLPLPPPGKSVFVSSLLKDTGVLSKMGSIDVELMRAAANSIDGLKMEVKMSEDHNSVRPESDYALQPGDRIRVRKHETDGLQSLMEFAGLR